jgi:hypothetical protein
VRNRPWRILTYSFLQGVLIRKSTKSGVKMKMLRLSAVVVLGTSLLATVAAADLRFAGRPFSPGQTVTASVPLSPQEKSYASNATNQVPDTAIAVIATPRTFDPRKTWPVLVVFSTSNFDRLNRDDLVQFYRDAALSEGWVVIAGDGRGSAPNDTNGWRAAMTLAALDALHKSFPGSDQWPVALAGFSGGAKRASLLAPVLYLKGCRLFGMYLTGMNQNVLSVSYKKSQLGPAFLRIPIFISSGTNDSIAPVGRAREITDEIRLTGFQSVRFETFAGGHAVKNEHTIKALRWFRRL